TADFRDRDDRTSPTWLCYPWNRRILLQGLIWPGVVVIAEILSQYSAQVPFGQDNQVVEALPPDAADHLFRVSILPGRMRRGDQLFDLPSFHPATGFLPGDLIPITEKKTRRGAHRKCFDHLPGPSGLRSDRR